MLTFQPRWVFREDPGRPEKAANAAFAEVRKRLIPYDSTSPIPAAPDATAQRMAASTCNISCTTTTTLAAAVPSPGWHRTRRPISKTTEQAA